MNASTNQHLCLSGLPSCSGAVPCVVCQRFVTERVVPRAMWLAGPPFNTDANYAALFMRAYAQAAKDGADHAMEHFRLQAAMVPPSRQASHTQHAPAPPAARAEPEPQPTLTEEEYLVLFQRSLLDGLKTMTEEHRVLMGKGVLEGTLEGWVQLSDAERDIMRQIFCPPLDAHGLPQQEAYGEASDQDEEDDGLPSNESAQKVVEAMRRGTLNENTLDPPPPPAPAEEPPATVADAAPAATPAPASDKALGRQPLTASREGHAGKQGIANGTESASAPVAGAQGVDQS
jgi:hypothetical protein